MPPFDTRYHITRRDVLQTGVAGLGAAGVTDAASFVSGIPNLSRAWVEIADDGDAAFVAAFDGNVERAFLAPGLDRSTLSAIVADEGLDVRFGTGSVDAADDVDDEEMLRGTVTDFADAGSTVRTDTFRVDPDALDEAIPIVDVADRAAPTDDDFLTVRMPDGFTYTLPEDARTVTSAVEVYEALRDNGEFAESPAAPVSQSRIAYDDGDPKYTFPAIEHRVDPDLAWLQGCASLKLATLDVPGSEHRFVNLYDPEWYADRAIEDAFEVGTAVANELGAAAVESVLLQPVPDPIGAGLDAAGVVSALDPEFIVREEPDDGGLFESFTGIFTDDAPPESWGRSAQASMQTNWLREALRPDRSTHSLDDHGLSNLSVLARLERTWVQLLATTTDADRESLSRIYAATLDEQRRIATNTRVELERAQGAVHEAEYWQALYEHAVTVCEEFRTLAEAQLDAVSALES